jgi:ABC-2 type transport system ATP-binding protein
MTETIVLLAYRLMKRSVTILLVTHFMDEAERLCDRVALIDSGRVIASDTPARLAARAGGGSHLRLRPSHPVDDALLTQLAEVTELRHEGSRLVVTGTGDLLNAVVRALAAAGAEALDARLESATLEDAYLRLIRGPPNRPQEVGSR